MTATQTALWLIAMYQRWISPIKGFRCAYSIMHSAPGCSGYAKVQIARHGVFAALPHIRDRFKACAAAASAMHQSKAQNSADEQKERNSNRSCLEPRQIEARCLGCCSATDV
jgi:putative component of membrane protein insertase Oxa1/YidC/SpoIIIJ protein YidD